MTEAIVRRGNVDVIEITEAMIRDGNRDTIHGEKFSIN